MPSVTVDSGYSAFSHVQDNLDDLGELAGAEDSDIAFLKEFLGDSKVHSLVQAHDTLKEQPLESVDSRASALVAETLKIVQEHASTDQDADELNSVLSDVHLRALLHTHDEISDKNFEDDFQTNQLSSPPPPVFTAVQDAVRLVGIQKPKNQPLGITVKLNENNEVAIARILAGSMIDKQGMLHVGDIIKEVNGTPVQSPEHLMDIIRSSQASITLKIVPAYQDQTYSAQVFMKAHFNYDPSKDRLNPCKEAGLQFKDGEVLEILSSDDPSWWQATKVDGDGKTGLIPSQALEEKRKAFVRPEYDYSKSFHFDKCELVIYEEVARMPPFQRKTLVLVGASGVGRRAMKERLIKNCPQKFAAAAPHTSRAPRDGEEQGKGYYFIDRESMEDDIRNEKLLEYGQFNGNLYGTKIDTILNVIRSGKMCVLDINPTSLKILKTSEFMPFIVFLAAPSADALRTMYEEGRRRPRQSQPGVMTIKVEDDFLDIVKESTQIEQVYKAYFDLTIVNDDFEMAYRSLRRALDELSTETQWVPVNWVY